MGDGSVAVFSFKSNRELVDESAIRRVKTAFFRARRGRKNCGGNPSTNFSFSPSGRKRTAHRLQRWVNERQEERVPSGTKEISHPSRHHLDAVGTTAWSRRGLFQVLPDELHSVLFKKHLQFFFEACLHVMQLLVFNVFRRVLNSRDADTKRAVSFLPFEVPELLKSIVNPF